MTITADEAVSAAAQVGLESSVTDLVARGLDARRAAKAEAQALSDAHSPDVPGPLVVAGEAGADATAAAIAACLAMSSAPSGASE